MQRRGGRPCPYTADRRGSKVWNLASLFFIISFGVEVVEVIEFDFGNNLVADLLVVATVVVQNISLWAYLSRHPHSGFWNSIRAIAFAFISVSITGAVVGHVPNGLFDVVVTVLGIVFLNVIFHKH